MSQNRGSRSGWLQPARVLRSACRLTPSSCNSSPTPLRPILCPMSQRLSLCVRRLLQVKSKGDCGPPRASGLTTGTQIVAERRIGLDQRLLSAARTPHTKGMARSPRLQLVEPAPDPRRRVPPLAPQSPQNTKVHARPAPERAPQSAGDWPIRQSPRRLHDDDPGGNPTRQPFNPLPIRTSPYPFWVF